MKGDIFLFSNWKSRVTGGAREDGHWYTFLKTHEKYDVSERYLIGIFHGFLRISIIQTSERTASKVRFFINSDRFFKGATIAVSSEKFRTFDRLLEHLSRIMCNQVTLPNGVRFIFALDGRNVEAVEELLHGENYVCSSSSAYKKLDYLKMAQEQDQRKECWKGMKRDTYYIGEYL